MTSFLLHAGMIGAVLIGIYLVFNSPNANGILQTLTNSSISGVKAFQGR